MARVNVPPLNLPTVVDNLCKSVTAGKLTAAACAQQVEAEIDRQMTIFVTTHSAATQTFIMIHKTTQSLFRTAEADTKGVFAKGDPSAAEVLELIAMLEGGLKYARSELEAFKEQKVAMVAQQPCRGPMCDPNNAPVMGTEYARLNAKYVDYRKSVLTVHINSLAAQDRVAEHVTRIEDMIQRAKVACGQVRDSAKKVFEEAFKKNTDALAEIVAKIKDVQGRSKDRSDDIALYGGQIKTGKITKAQCLVYVKSLKTSLDTYALDLKGCRTKIKTCRLRLDSMKVQADRLETLVSKMKEATNAVVATEKALEVAIKYLDGCKNSLVQFNAKAKAMK